ncbi:unnamed protein product [Symbiodinium sp. CCMP2592]|nr:unnamed protein product [Symbiodinium sp. CCMP2592]
MVTSVALLGDDTALEPQFEPLSSAALVTHCSHASLDREENVAHSWEADVGLLFLRTGIDSSLDYLKGFPTTFARPISSVSSTDQRSSGLSSEDISCDSTTGLALSDSVCRSLSPRRFSRSQPSNLSNLGSCVLKLPVPKYRS